MRLSVQKDVLALAPGMEVGVVCRVDGGILADSPGDFMDFIRLRLTEMVQLLQNEINIRIQSDDGVRQVAHDVHGIAAVFPDKCVKAFLRNAQKQHITEGDDGINAGLAAQDGKFSEAALLRQNSHQVLILLPIV